MSCSGERYKKWRLHTNTQWPKDSGYADKVLQSWRTDHHLNAYHWQAPLPVDEPILQPHPESIHSYIDYLNCANLDSALRGEHAIFLLDGYGVILYLSATTTLSLQLGELELSVGSVMSKRNIGTTAFSLAKQYQTTEHICTHEAYLKALHAYHMIAMPVENSTHELYLMGWFIDDQRDSIAGNEVLLRKTVCRRLQNMQTIHLLSTILDHSDAMIFVFDQQGNVTLKNQQAKLHSSVDGVTFNSQVIFSFTQIYAAGHCDSRVIESYLHDWRYRLRISTAYVENNTIVYAELESDKVANDEWKREIVGEFLAKDSYLDKVIKLRQQMGMRLFITGEVGTGHHYIVDFIAKKIGSKRLVHVDCLAGFSAKESPEQVKIKFIDILCKANNQLLYIENIEWLASDLQVILLKTLSSSMLLTNDNKMRPVHFDLLSSASNNHWQTSRTSELLSLMLSTNHLSLKSLVDENAKLQPLIIRIIARLGLNHDGLLSINDAAMTALLAHHWPGNYLEVFQTIENAVMKCSHHVITELDLPTRASAKIDGSEMENISDVERRIISYAWQKNNGQLSLICHELGFSRTTLWRKMKKLNLNKNTLPLGKLQRVCND